MAQGTRTQRLNVFGRFARYAGDVRSELRRVVWPQPAEVRNSSLVVIVTLLFFIVLTTIADYLSSAVVNAIASLRG